MVVYETKERVSTPIGEHLQSRRGLTLVLHHQDLTAMETLHLERCANCNEWLSTFTTLARRAGFPIAYTIPPRPVRGVRRVSARPVFGPPTNHAESMT